VIPERLRPEWTVVTDLLRPGGVLHLVYETPSPARSVADVVSAAMAGHGLAPEVVAGPSPTLFRVTGRRQANAYARK
jgi:hypothetical protein